jgi:hypothetical protein
VPYCRQTINTASRSRACRIADERRDQESCYAWRHQATEIDLVTDSSRLRFRPCHLQRRMDYGFMALLDDEKRT